MKKPSSKHATLDYAVNFGLCLGIFVLLGVVLMQRPVAEAVVCSFFMATGFLLFDLLLGSPGDPHKQAQTCMRLLAGAKIEGAKEKFSQKVIVGLVFVGGTGITAILLQLFYGDQLWAWIVGVVVGIGVTALVITLVRRNLKSWPIS